MEYYSAIKKNKIMPFAPTWMDLEIVTLSEVSQRRTNIIWYSLYVESKKKMYKWTSLQKRERVTDVENNLMVNKEKRGGINWETGIDIYTLLYIKQITNKDLLYNEGNSIFCNDPYGKRILKRVDIWLRIAESLCCTPHTNNTVNQLYFNEKQKFILYVSSNKRLFNTFCWIHSSNCK